MEIDPVRLEHINSELTGWLGKKQTTKKEVESLVGLLNFVAKCVCPTRIFMSHMFDFLKEMPKTEVTMLPDEFRQDVYWWLTFMPSFNGVSLIPIPKCAGVGTILVTDSCLTVGGEGG